MCPEFGVIPKDWVRARGPQGLRPDSIRRFIIPDRARSSNLGSQLSRRYVCQPQRFVTLPEQGRAAGALFLKFWRNADARDHLQASDQASLPQSR
jgi:hypothetical protein